ncbi:GatB/YqeY domain-containing protein [Oceaniradius stylonematis]|uniref:GatB/YqeY domain-containing protein n=1 Tax=Oceaniradius stylonematis TaxID=2184161 RepID=UPI0035CFB6F9
MIVTLLFGGAGGDRLSPAEANTILVPNATAGASTPRVTFGHLALECQLPVEQEGSCLKCGLSGKPFLIKALKLMLRTCMGHAARLSFTKLYQEFDMREAIHAALKEAQNSQDKCRISVLRLVLAAVKDRDIANRNAGKDPVSDKEIVGILSKMISQRKASAADYEQGGRLELADQERYESKVIAEFLPAQMCEDEVKQACAAVVEDTGAEGLRDMGKCMNTLKQKFPGQMDFSKASGIVRGMLR